MRRRPSRLPRLASYRFNRPPNGRNGVRPARPCGLGPICVERQAASMARPKGSASVTDSIVEGSDRVCGSTVGSSVSQRRSRSSAGSSPRPCVSSGTAGSASFALLRSLLGPRFGRLVPPRPKRASVPLPGHRARRARRSGRGSPRDGALHPLADLLRQLNDDPLRGRGRSRAGSCPRSAPTRRRAQRRGLAGRRRRRRCPRRRKRDGGDPVCSHLAGQTFQAVARDRPNASSDLPDIAGEVSQMCQCSGMTPDGTRRDVNIEFFSTVAVVAPDP